MKLDLAVVDRLDLNLDKTRAFSARGGGSSSASTWKITLRLDNGTDKTLFKLGAGKRA